jgi:hypothetical protein
MRRSIVLILAVTFVAACTSAGHKGQVSGAATGLPSSTPQVIAAADGASLTRIALDAGNVAYLQVVDPHRMVIDQILGPVDGDAPAPSAYYPRGGSPRFRRLTADQMQSWCRVRYGTGAFSAVNAAFFETYDASTALAFPLKVDGRVLTGGSSPYGPIAHPRAAYYRNVTLRALTWDGNGATIARYDPATGSPLSDPGIRDGLVTYLYRDHPSDALGGDPPNRYQLLGVVDADGSRDLAILTVDRASLEAGARILHQHGVTGDVLTVDGGISTYLWAASAGDLEAADNAPGSESSLPHYLCIHHR